MEDRFLNGWSTRNLMQRLAADERCPLRIRQDLAKELPAFDALRRSQVARMSPAELFPASSFVMRIEGLVMAGVRDPQQLKPMIENIARSSAISLGSEDTSALVDALLNPKGK